MKFKPGPNYMAYMVPWWIGCIIIIAGWIVVCVATGLILVFRK